MARTAITLQTTSRDGIVPSFAAANVDGMAFDNSSHRVLLYVKNGGGAPINVTIQIPGTIEGSALADKVVAVADGAEKIIGPFPTIYDQVSTTPDIPVAAVVDFSAVTSVTVAAIKAGSLA